MEHRGYWRNFLSRSLFVAAAFAAALLSASRASWRNSSRGIDVSRHQGFINWTSVKNSGVQFAFAKATEGVDFVDIRYHTNMQGARAAGVYIGPYSLLPGRQQERGEVHKLRWSAVRAGLRTRTDDAVSEANDFLEAILPYYLTGQHLPPVADVESLPAFGNISLERTFISNWVQLFSDTVQSALGVRPLIYTSRSVGLTRTTRPRWLREHDLWLAWWRGTGTTQPPAQSDTPLWQPWQFWQWTDQWSVPGISTAR